LCFRQLSPSSGSLHSLASPQGEAFFDGSVKQQYAFVA
jgi:hypothetical protein